MDKRRGKVFLVIVFALAAALAGRLFYIQIVGHNEMCAAAAVQQQVTIVGLDRRGTIYDRNMMPLTGGSKEYVYLTHRSRVDSEFYEIMDSIGAVSYTHLDVYKRQAQRGLKIRKLLT